MLVVPMIDVPVPPPAPVMIVAVHPLFSISIPQAPVAVISNPLIFEIVGVVIVGEVASTGFQVPVGVEFLIIFPVVPSNNAGTQSVALAGQATSQAPEGVDQVQSHRRNVEDDGVPVAFIFAGVTTLLSIVHTVPLEDTVISPLSQSATDQDIEISPLPRREVELIVFMFVPDIRVACFESICV